MRAYARTFAAAVSTSPTNPTETTRAARAAATPEARGTPPPTTRARIKKAPHLPRCVVSIETLTPPPAHARVVAVVVVMVVVVVVVVVVTVMVVVVVRRRLSHQPKLKPPSPLPPPPPQRTREIQLRVRVVMRMPSEAHSPLVHHRLGRFQLTDGPLGSARRQRAQPDAQLDAKRQQRVRGERSLSPSAPRVSIRRPLGYGSTERRQQ